MNYRCCTCKEEKDEVYFSLADKKSGRRASKCKACMKTYQRLHYDTNKNLYVERNKRHTIRLREELNTAKDRPCADCGVKYPPWVMEFDHCKDDVKIDNVGTLFHRKATKMARIEIEKCDLVCANCHRMRTHSRFQEKSRRSERKD